MTHLAHRLIAIAATALAASALSLSACAPAEEITATPEDEGNGGPDALSGNLEVGATLIATTNVNLRGTASTSGKILHVVPEGDEVTVVSASPSNGFYKVNHDGTVGYSYAAYYKLAPTQPSQDPPGGAVNPADLLAKLGACKQISGTTKFRKDSGGSATIPVCSVTGAIWWSSDMDVDCDGGSGAVCKSDPDYQSDTAGVDSKGKALDASTLPYVVIPMSSNGFNYKTSGLKMGSVVAVIYNNQIAYGILGDVGPAGVIGEASFAMAKKLGINSSPTSGGVDSGVTYVAFTGAGSTVTKNEDNAQAVQIGETLATKLINGN